MPNNKQSVKSPKRKAKYEAQKHRTAANKIRKAAKREKKLVQAKERRFKNNPQAQVLIDLRARVRKIKKKK